MQFWDQIPESVRDLVDRIAVRSRALHNRIHDILALNDLRSGRAHPEGASEVELREFLEAVAEPLTEAAAKRRVRVAISSPILVFTTGRHRLEVLVSNILANAISYSHEGGAVEVVGAEEPEAVVIRVSDHGIGISAEALPHIFEEYYRTPEAAAFNKASTGLGLAIVKEAAQQVGARIAVTSERGQGTTFTIRVPRAEHETSMGEIKI
jgi:signal transduction histidine kinase